jgi:hypothetical protein
MLRQREHLAVAAAVAVGPQFDVVRTEMRAQPGRLLGAATVAALQGARAPSVVSDRECRAEDVFDVE